MRFSFNLKYTFVTLFVSAIAVFSGGFAQKAWSATPVAPSKLTATAKSSSRITLSWIDNSNNETGFKIERSLSSSGAYAVIATVGPNVRTYANTGLIQNTTYYYRVRSYIASEITKYSARTSVASAKTATLAAPADLVASSATTTRITLTWTDKSDTETRLNVESATAGSTGPFTIVGSAETEDGTITINGLTPNMTYYFRVRAYDGTNYSAYSNTVMLKTPGGIGYTITASTSANGAISPSGAVSVSSGATQTFTMTPMAGYSLTSVLVDGTTAAVNSPYVFQNVTANHTISATFTDITPPTVSISSPVSGNTFTNRPLLTYAVSDGTVVVTVDNFVVPKVSGMTLDQLSAGAHTVRVESADSANNKGFAEVVFTVVATPPLSCSVVINADAPTAPDPAVTLVISSANTTTVVTSLRTSFDNLTWSAWQPFVASQSATLPGANGTKTVYAQVRDSAGVSSSICSDSIELVVIDTTPPTGAIAINNRASYTNHAAVTLTLTCADTGSGCSQMQLSSNDTTWTVAEPFTTTKSWTLISNDGTQTVFVKYQNTAGYWMPASTNASIILDTTPPTVTITAPSTGTASNNTPSLSYTVSDGTVSVKVDGLVVNKVSGSTLDLLTDGVHTVRVEATDAASNTGFAEVVILVAAAPSVPLVTITSPASGVTNNRTPVLSYLASGDTVTVTVDGSIVNKVAGNTLDTLADGSHTVRVEATNSVGTGFAEVTFTVDTVAPTVIITSPASGPLTTKTPALTYSASDGAVVVKVDGKQVYKTSGNTLDWLASGSHTVRVEATDSAGNPGFAEVTFSVPADADDASPACNGSATYVVGASSFTNGITVPAAGSNAVVISSPTAWQNVNGPRTIIKGAMDTTIPVTGVTVQVADLSGTYTYPAQVNGKYFAAVAPVSGGDATITVTALDQNGVPHQATVTVVGVAQPDNVRLFAGPGTGIPMPKQSGQNALDVILSATTSLANPITSYIWDFTGSGANQLSCFSHATITASYQQPGLYLTKVTVSDNTAHSYAEVAIVNVLDRTAIDTELQAKWMGMKAMLTNGNIEGALLYFNTQSQDRYGTIFTTLGGQLQQLVQNMQSIQLIYANDQIAKYRIRKNETIGGQTVSVTYYMYFVRDKNGIWTIDSF